MDRDEVEGVKWDAWNRALASVAGILAVGGRRDDGALDQLYNIAVELRERLRYSQGRLRGLKQELSVTVAATRSERHEAMARLQELETEVARLAGAVQAQGTTLAARETVSQSQAAENDQLRRHIAALERQLQRSEEDRRVTMVERNDALRHLERMTKLLEESEGRVAEVQGEHNRLLGELVVTKGRLADMSALETLYGAARDELQRLDKENLELKDMVAAGAVQLGRSRILEALGIPDKPATERSTATPRTRRSRPGTPGATTAIMSYGGSPGSVGLAAGGLRLGSDRSRSAPRSRRGTSLPSGSISGPPSPAGRLQVSSPRAASRAHSLSHFQSNSQSPSLEDPVSEMAFLGPPSAAYPPDPENYLFYRVGGGYEPKVNPTQPTNPQPRASGWVPKDVVRLIQAFRHSYGLSLEWRFWEPLVLMIDEVYRNRADSTLAAMKAAQQEKLKAIKRQVRAALGYPSAVANGKINHLQRQLKSARKILAWSDRKGEQSLRQMAMKDYHLGYQLDRAVEENYTLRRSLQDLEQRYSHTIEGAAPGRFSPGGHVTTPAGSGVPRGRSITSASPPSAAGVPSPQRSNSDLYASALHSPQRMSSIASQQHIMSPKRPHEHELERFHRVSDRYVGGPPYPYPHAQPQPQPQLQTQRSRQSLNQLPHEADDGLPSQRSLSQQRNSQYSDQPQQFPRSHSDSQGHSHSHNQLRASDGTFSRRTSMSALPGGLGARTDGASMGGLSHT
ncbi:hypothetical protein VaNZ11_014878 [Volvox africanus]|uniref:Uncharacterized protein n=1 Tax=Volvox africanus TaxID=51714 RepID=A0ABQ5SL08_9CHLO|nr:hypothetical protein VaNZ11_014878 [Volvox africanus]